MTRWSHNAHVMFSTHGTWLPGDPCGFRDHGHRIHSSGDYKIPPPVGEPKGLRSFSEGLSGGEVFLPDSVRLQVAEAVAAKLLENSCSTRIIAVGGAHVHVLMGAGDGDIKPVVGRAKQAASHRIRAVLPGTVWAQGCHVVRIRDEAHYAEVVKYIDDHRLEGALIWTPPAYRRSIDEHSSRRRT